MEYIIVKSSINGSVCTFGVIWKETYDQETLVPSLLGHLSVTKQIL